MYVSPSGHDYDIQVNGDLGRALHLVRTRAGHIMLPISGFQGQRNYQNEIDDIRKDGSRTEWEAISAQSLR